MIVSFQCFSLIVFHQNSISRIKEVLHFADGGWMVDQEDVSVLMLELLNHLILLSYDVAGKRSELKEARNEFSAAVMSAIFVHLATNSIPFYGQI